jgi:hypothetical protein
MVPLIGGRFARACSPSGVRKALSKKFLLAAIGSRGKTKSWPEAPANPATLVMLRDGLGDRLEGRFLLRFLDDV